MSNTNLRDELLLEIREYAFPSKKRLQIPTNRVGHSICSVLGNYYIFGGWDSQCTNTTFMLTLVYKGLYFFLHFIYYYLDKIIFKWKKIDPDDYVLPRERMRHVACAYKDCSFIINGGYGDSGISFNDTWLFNCGLFFILN